MKSVIMFTAFLIAILCISTVFAIDATEVKYSTLSITANHIATAGTPTTTFFRGLLYCEKGCIQDDYFSFSGGLNTPTDDFSISSINIVFFDQSTNKPLISLSPGKQYLTIPVKDNEFSEINLPWSAPIPEGTYVPFQGTIVYRLSPRQAFADSSRFAYFPTNPTAYPQLMYFETRFQPRGSAYIYADGIWSKDYAQRGLFAAMIDDIAADMVGLQVKLVGGYTWAKVEQHGCEINARPANLTLNAATNTMLFVPSTPGTVFTKGQDVSLRCVEKMLLPLSTEISVLSQKTVAQINFITTAEEKEKENFSYPFKYVFVHEIKSVLEADPPQQWATAELMGDLLICEYSWSYLQPLINNPSDHDTIQLTVRSTKKNDWTSFGNNVIGRITSIDDHRNVYQKINNWLYEHDGKFSRKPIQLTGLSKDHVETSAKLTIAAPLVLSQGKNDIDGQVTCRLDYYHPNKQDDTFSYSTVVAPLRQNKKASLFIEFDYISPTKYDIIIKIANIRTTLNTLTVYTQTYESFFTGNADTCTVQQATYDQSNDKFTTFGLPFTPSSTSGDVVNSSAFLLMFDKNTDPAHRFNKDVSYIVTCTDMTYAPTLTTTPSVVTLQNVINKPPTAIVTSFTYVTDSDPVPAVKYTNGVITRDYQGSNDRKSSFLWVLAIILVLVVVIVVLGYFVWKWKQRRDMINQGMNQSLLFDDDSNNLIIQ